MVSAHCEPQNTISELCACWGSVGTWAIKEQHGAAAKLVVMFALSLQRPTTAHSSCIRYLRPRIWEVSTPYGTTTQRAALLEDELVSDLLITIDATEGHPTPVFPRTPCSSIGVDGWAHAMASRKDHRGMKNFAALLAKFGLPPLKSPFEIYQLSLWCFMGSFSFDDGDQCALLASQHGCKRVCPTMRFYRQPPTITDSIGELRIVERETYFLDVAVKPL